MGCRKKLHQKPRKEHQRPTAHHLVIGAAAPEYPVVSATGIFISNGDPKNGLLQFDSDLTVPIYIRSEIEYNEIAQHCGLEARGTARFPPFTAQFLAKYPTDIPTQHSEYMILTYQKMS